MSIIFQSILTLAGVSIGCFSLGYIVRDNRAKEINERRLKRQCKNF